MLEGSAGLDTPEPVESLVGRFVGANGVTILYSGAPTRFAQVHMGREVAKRTYLSSLRLLGSVGEPIKPPGMAVVHKVIGGER